MLPNRSGEDEAISSKRKPYMTGSFEAYSSSLERRSACRYPAKTDSVSLGWWDGPEFRTTSGQVKNISLEGALTFVELAPPVDSAVWIRLDGAPATDWVEAVVVSITKGKHGPHQVRIRFQHGCPFSFFDSAINKFAAEDESDRGAR